jgi:N-acetyl-gamma-glutamyl-phosphate reductase
MQTVPVGIVGASGYSGLELSRILALHPQVELKFLGSDKWAGEFAARRAGLPGAAGKLKYAPQEKSGELGRECAVVFLATPAEASLELGPRLIDAGVRVIDLSGAFRLRDAALYPKFYGFQHPRPDLLAEAFYGLPELQPPPRGTRLVANPGCYPTAAALALAPLVEAGLLTTDPLIVDAASGVTGAGRRAAEDYSFTEIDGDFRAYKVLRHQHQPEIAQSLRRPLTFTPHLLPVKRGILATCYGRLATGNKPDSLRAALLHKYAQTPFVQVLEGADQVSLKGVTGTNNCQVAVAAEGEVVVVIAAIDNLVKGAAGQAVQNLNLILGWPETAGLDALRGFHP